MSISLPSSNEHVVSVSLQDEMRTSYLDYAMSVIIGRAIPDVRDGLKPVHRRILYSMYEQRILPGSAHKKSAKVVGDVLGKYHPHGDASVYDAMVRLAQEFSMRYPLIDGQGNFGSIDGDPAAAYRYTEARLAHVGLELLEDITKECVDFASNFDDSELEPKVLPSRIPNLLVNGSGGIAVGMATNIPPHNLGEILDATVYLIQNPHCPIEELMRLVPGPDFPTAGLLYGRSGIVASQRTGRGSLLLRARMHTEKTPGTADREQIVVTEIPYQVNKARVLTRMGELIREKKLEGIADRPRDESNQEGIRIVIELKKDVHPEIVINQLYQMTDLQTTFGVINLAIVRGRPAVLNLREMLAAFVEHRREVVTRRTRYELRQADARRELVEGLGVASSEVERVVQTIRAAADVEAAQAALLALPLHHFGAFLERAGRPAAEIEAANRDVYFLSERQVKAILEMRLSRLTGLEQHKLAQEYGELCHTLDRLRAILREEALLLAVLVEELQAIRTRYADKRLTEIVETEAEIHLEDLIQEEDMVVTISHAGYIKRTSMDTYRAQKRGGKGKLGMEAREEDWVSKLFVASTHAYVFFLSHRGKVFVKKVYEIPQAARNAKGRALVNFVGLEEGDKIAAIVEVAAIVPGKFLTTLTTRGQIKKTELCEYENFREKGIIGVKIEEGDALLSAELTDGTRDVLIATQLGQSIRFPETQVRPTGRATQGVRAIDLADNDAVVGFAVTEPERNQVLTVCEKGYGKRTSLEEFRIQHRGGKGVILIDASDRNGKVIGVQLVKEGDEVMLMTTRGQTLRTKVDDIRETGRNTQGVRLMSVAKDEPLVAVERLPESEPDSEPEEGAEESPTPTLAEEPLA